MKNEIKFNIQIIYCFPNYSYFSFAKLNTDLKEMKKAQQQNQIDIQALRDEIRKLKEDNKKIMNELNNKKNNTSG